MWPLTLACGLAFGIAFGLAGVGSVFAVPILVYAVGLTAHEAVCVAMITVAFLSALGSSLRWKRGEMDLRIGASVAAMGILGAPIGALISRFLSGRWLMLVFACFVIFVAIRMLIQGREPSIPGAHALAGKGAHRLALALAGLATGILAGLLGVGGLLIVPSLVILGGIDIHRAIATSLPVIFTISLSATSVHLLIGQRIPAPTTVLFISGGLFGMAAGMWFRKRLSEQRLQFAFAVIMLAIAAFTLARNILW
jgi:uncharacterized membrane protein YfcA